MKFIQLTRIIDSKNTTPILVKADSVSYIESMVYPLTFKNDIPFTQIVVDGVFIDVAENRDKIMKLVGGYVYGG